MPVKNPTPPRFLPPGPRRSARAVVLYPELVGLVLRRYRDRAQLRQADLAVELAWAQPKISRLERGDSYLTVDQLQGIVAVLNQKLPLVGEDPIGYWTVLAHADQLAQDLVVLEYDVTFCTGPEWAGAGALLRGDQLRAALALAHVPFSP